MRKKKKKIENEKVKIDYPEFNFINTEDFELNRKFVDEIEGIDEKIQYYNVQMDRFNKQRSPYSDSGGINFYLLLQYERDYWDFCNKIDKRLKLSIESDKEDSFLNALWVENFLSDHVLKMYFQPRELFDFDIVKIKKYIKRLGSITNQIVYLRYIFKEFEIQTKLYPGTYTKQSTGNFASKILQRHDVLIKMIKHNEHSLLVIYHELKKIIAAKNNRLSFNKYILSDNPEEIINDKEKILIEDLFKEIRSNKKQVAILPTLYGYLLMIGDNYTEHGWVITQSELNKLYETSEKYYKK